MSSSDHSVRACPECDSADVSHRNGRTDPSIKGTYRCGDCGHEFTRPIDRPSDGRGGGWSGSAIGHALIEMDPDDFPPDRDAVTDGGRVVEEAQQCRDCDRDAVRGGLCPEHWRKYRGDLLADGGRTFLCVLCRRPHSTTGKALECCGDRFDDRDLDSDPGLRTDGGSAELAEHVRKATPEAILGAISNQEAVLRYEERYIDVVFEQKECPDCGETCEHQITSDSNLGTETWECSHCHDVREFSPDGGPDSVEIDRLRELGLTERQIDEWKDGRRPVREVFDLIDFYGEISPSDLLVELDWSEQAIHQALAELRNGYQIVDRRADPDDRRRRLYYVNEQTSAAEIRSDGGGGSKYTIPTGDGYLGVWATHSWSLTISIGTYQHINWRSDDDVWVVDQEDEPGIAIVDDPPETTVSLSEEYLDTANVRRSPVGTYVTVRGRALRSLEGFEPGQDVRAYDRDDGGILLVTASDDPFVDGDHTSEDDDVAVIEGAAGHGGESGDSGGDPQ